MLGGPGGDPGCGPGGDPGCGAGREVGPVTAVSGSEAREYSG